jgi:hypothetical protein
MGAMTNALELFRSGAVDFVDWLGRAVGIIDSMNTHLVPNTGNIIESVKRITSVVKANRPDACAATGETKLLVSELVVKAPVVSKPL